MSQYECSFHDVADSLGTGDDPFQGAPVAGNDCEAAFSRTSQGVAGGVVYIEWVAGMCTTMPTPS